MTNYFEITLVTFVILEKGNLLEYEGYMHS